MVDEKLVHEIRVRLKQGHDLVEQREVLFNLGYSARDIHDAIDYVIDEMMAEERETKEIKETGESKKTFLKPISFSFVRIIIPIIIFIILIIQIFSNYSNIPSIAVDRCKVAEINAQIEQFNVSEDVEQAKKEILPLQVSIWNIDRDNIDRTRSTMITNFPVYFLRLNWINPFLPVPCEKVYFEQSNNCRFYSDKDTYDCLKKYGDESFVPINIEYHKVSTIVLLINIFVLLVEFFIINTLLVIVWKFIKEHTTKKAKQVIEVFIVLAIIIIVVAILFGIIQSLRMITG
jgi:hypothetical protein